MAGDSELVPNFSDLRLHISFIFVSHYGHMNIHETTKSPNQALLYATLIIACIALLIGVIGLIKASSIHEPDSLQTLNEPSQGPSMTPMTVPNQGGGTSGGNSTFGPTTVAPPAQ